MREIILVNRARCKKCGDIIESTAVHELKRCQCGTIAVDGGHRYLRRCGNREDWEDLSVTEAPQDSAKETGKEEQK